MLRQHGASSMGSRIRSPDQEVGRRQDEVFGGAVRPCAAVPGEGGDASSGPATAHVRPTLLHSRSLSLSGTLQTTVHPCRVPASSIAASAGAPVDAHGVERRAAGATKRSLRHRRACDSPFGSTSWTVSAGRRSSSGRMSATDQRIARGPTSPNRRTTPTPPRRRGAAGSRTTARGLPGRSGRRRRDRRLHGNRVCGSRRGSRRCRPCSGWTRS